jgi:hypothetical protein
MWLELYYLLNCEEAAASEVAETSPEAIRGFRTGEESTDNSGSHHRVSFFSQQCCELAEHSVVSEQDFHTIDAQVISS